MSVFLNQEHRNGACWYVPDDGDPSVLIPARDAPVEQADVSPVFEHQQAALSTRRRLQLGCAVPMTTTHGPLGAIFLATERPVPCFNADLRFLSLVADRIALAVDSVLSRGSGHDQGTNENLALGEEVSSASMFEEMVGASDALSRVLGQVKIVAPTDTSILITGESGTGKELVARAIHKRSQRSHRAFVGGNCAAIPPSLIASELFGCEKGAFTGAAQRHPGRFELANGGTIFLDEIGDIPPETQIALLRVLQEREFERVGGTQSIPINVRVLAATNRDLRAAVDAGTFRLDLFYRLNVFPIRVPSLRERMDDILLLAKYFIEHYASKAGKKIKNIERKSLEWLQAYEWPGNASFRTWWKGA
jgi:transcriptional regulator with GAF, ATPase, and Fis domain